MMDERELARVERDMEEYVHTVISPMEPLIMRLQSYLVWERPRRSFVLMLVFHIIFFYIKYSGQRVIFILSLAALLFFILHTWRRKIWPEIRVRPPSPEGADQWTPVHVGLLSVPEISHYISLTWLYVRGWTNKWSYLRMHHRFLFCVLNMAAFSALAIVGRYISGFLLIYILCASLTVWPSFYYHDIPQTIYLYCEPLFMRLDYYLTFRGKYPHHGKQSTQRESEEEDEDFLPSADLDPAVTAALARAITDSEDEEQSPPLSTQESVNSSDENEIQVRDMLPDTPLMPDVVDNNSDADFGLPEMETTPGRRQKKRRPRAALNTDTFQPMSDFNQSNSSAAENAFSSMAADIVTDQFTTALASAFGKSSDVVEDSQNGHEIQDGRQNQDGQEYTADETQDSDIDQMISDDFDFLDDHGL